MALQLRITGEGLRVTGDPAAATGLAPPPPAETLLANEAGETIVTDAGETIAVEPTHA